jgi:hypothetical protein
MKKLASLLICAPLLTACATAPSAPPAPLVVQCPRVQPINWPAPEPAFLPRMQTLLSGKLPEPIPSDYSLPPARLRSMPP